jgi:hypothetical protein
MKQIAFTAFTLVTICALAPAQTNSRTESETEFLKRARKLAEQEKLKVEPQVFVPDNVPDPNRAALRATSIANAECSRIYGRSPFSETYFKPKLVDGRWICGGFDPGGPAGFSADVSFFRNGSDEKVRVYYSSDKRRPAR